MIDPYDFISYPVWLSLPNDTRYKIAELFKIEPRGVRQTLLGHTGGTVISDGFLHADLAVITKKSMEEITGVHSDDFYVCFRALLDKVEGKEIKQQNDVQQEKQAEAHAGTKKKAGRPRKAR